MDPKVYLRDPGIFKKNGKFYHQKSRLEVQDSEILERLRKYRVPPAWENVWYASNPKSHVQVHGTDTGGKKQYILSERWISGSKKKKYQRMKTLIRDIGSFKRKISLRSLRHGEIITKDLLINLLFNLLIDTHIRVGNEKYANKNKTFGLTTMRQKHLIHENGNYLFSFLGKSHINHTVQIPSEYNTYFIQLKKDQSNKPLFYYNDNIDNTIDSEEMNCFLKSNMGSEYTCKDFRTYSANILFIKFFLKNTNASREVNKKDIKNIVLKSIDNSAELLGHTRNISRKSYISENLLNYCLDSFDTAVTKSSSDLLSKVWS
jgi:DNA topoisomerase-1